MRPLQSIQARLNQTKKSQKDSLASTRILLMEK